MTIRTKPESLIPTTSGNNEIRNILNQKILVIAVVMALTAIFPATSRAAVAFSAGQNLGSSDSRDAAVGDFDGDGDLDIVDCPWGTSERVWLNNGAGTFTNTSTFGGSAYGCKAADMNNNGTMDIIIGVYSSGTNLSIYWNNGSAAFSAGPSVSEGYKYGFTIGDIDGDGDIDFTTGASNSLAGRVYRNNGNSTFSQIAANLSTAYDRQHVLTDVDNDGDLDLIRGVYNAANQVWLNNGSGSFSNLGGQSFTSQSTLDIVTGDFDADGDMDFAESNGTTSLTWVNNGSGIFSGGSALSSGFGYGIDSGDVDSDGDLDILIGNLSGGSKVYLNNGAGAFSNSGVSITSASTDDALFGEFTGDGMIDVLSVNSGANAMKVWQNTTAPYTNTTPTAPTLTAQGSRFINANPKAIKFYWTGGTDTETVDAMLTYDFRLGTTSGGCEINCGSFGGNGTAFGPGNADASPYSFKIAPGTYYWSVRTVDLTYTRSSWSAEDNFTVTLDTVAPTTPTVNDGTGSDVDFLVGNTTFDANWSASTDATAGIDGYWYSIGTSAGASDTLSWTWAGNVTSVTATGLTLTGGVTYYFSVRAQDNAENLSTVATSDGAKPFFYNSGQSLDNKTTYGGDLADINNDGYLDYISGNFSGRNVVYLNDGAGTMSAYSLLPSPPTYPTRVIKSGDIDGDGDIDIIEGNYSGTRENLVYVNDGSGNFSDTFQSLNFTNTTDIDMGDWDKDGDLDLIESNYGTDDVLWENDGTGTFTTSGQVLTGASTNGAKFIDFDGDGDLDIVREIYGVGSKLWRNDDGTYTDQGYSTNTQQQDIKIADFDGDGDVDYAYAIINSVYRVTIMKNTGAGSFLFGSGATGPNMNAWGLEVGDIDGDGDYDIIDGGEFSGDVYANNGSGSLTYLLSLPKNGSSSGYQGANLGDLDGDGDLDAILRGYNNIGDTVWINFLNGSNSAPSAPSISAIADVGIPLGSTVKRTTFTWTPGSDAETTDADLLTYDVRAGTGSGLVNTVHVFFTGTPNYVGNGAGNASFTTSKSVDLAEGTYYWSARTVDSSYNRSSWDTEDSFVILPPFTNTGQALGGAGDSRMPCAGDFDGDGDLDVAETNYGGGGANYLWKNNGSGTMTNAQTWSTNPTQDCDVGDFDGDGDLDIAEANYSASVTNKIFLNNGSGTFSAGGDFGAMVTSNNLFVADFDGDGDLDLYEGNNGTTNYIHLNDGTGTFTQGSAMGAAASTNSDVADIDGDGDMDIAIAMYGSANYLWINNGDATFYDAGIYMNTDSTRGVKFADVEGDGDQDLIFGNMASEPGRIWINDGAGGFTDSGQTLGAEQTSGIDVGDIDGDGDIDFIAGNKNTPSANLIWLNDGSGNFSDSGFQMGAYTGTWTVLLLDLDNDGDLDVFEACQGQANRVWRSNQNFTNAAPSAPSLTPEPDVNPVWANAQSTTLVWGVGSDSETTDSDLLTYDVRLGTSSGSCDVFCGFFPEASLLNNGPGIMKNATSLNIDLSVLNTTTYYWSVRTVDSTNKGGSFSAEDSFTLTPAFEDSGQNLGTGNGWDVSAADFDGDNDMDMLITTYDGSTNKVYLNDSAGNMSYSGLAAHSVGTGNWVTNYAADMDNDGDIDIFIGYQTANSKLYLNNGSGSFSDSGQSLTTTPQLAYPAPGDVDADGDIDMVAFGGYGNPTKVWTNNGAGTLTNSGQSLGSYDCARGYLSDFDGDGDIDIYEVNWNNTNPNPDRVYVNDGTGVFSDSGQSLGTYNTQSASIGDYDSDGDIDVLATNPSGQGSVIWLNNGSGSLTNSGQSLASSCGGRDGDSGDIDGDGDLDITLACDTASGDMIFLNNGSGVFSDSGISLEAGGASYANLLKDLDGDGDLDIIVAKISGSKIFINNLNPANATPTAPALTDEADFMTWSNVTDNVTLNWSAGSDGETAAGLLTYDVRIGTSPDTCDIFCGFFPSSGTTPLLGSGYGNVSNALSLNIDVPSDVTTTYYWSARTVDATFERSAFPANDTFTITPTFSDSGQTLGTAFTFLIALGDLDGDDDLDIIDAHSGVTLNQIWMNDGTGTFSIGAAFSVASDSRQPVIFDAEGDGDLDFFEVTTSVNKLWLNDGSGTFTDSGQSIGTQNDTSGAAADFDGDGDIDVIDGCYYCTDRLWVNDGAGTFSDSGKTLGAGTSAYQGDVDNDGDVDYLMSHVGGGGNQVWINDGTGTFTNSGQTLGTDATYQIALADVDGDGDNDVITANGGTAVPDKIWMNNGSGVFTDSGQTLGSYLTTSVFPADLDGDGDIDYAAACNTSSPNRIWLNNGSGVFTDSGISLGTDSSWFVVGGDLDADDDIDLAVANATINRIYINNLNHGNNAPTAPAPSAEPDSNTSVVQLQWDTTGVSDAETAAALLTYDLRIGTTSGGCETFCGLFTPTGNSVSPNPGNVGTASSITKTLADGTYYWAVRTVDTGFVKSAWTTEDSFLIDTTPPTTIATVNDGSASDVDFASSATQLLSNWTSATDTESGITTYWIGIGTSSGATNTLDWTSAGLVTSTTTVNLSLSDGVTYYVTVRAENGVALYGTAANSDGQLVDTSAPSSVAVSDSLSTDVDFASSSTQLSANWTASADAHSGIARYWYAIGTTAGGTNVRSWTDNALSTSVTATGLTLTDGVTYYFTVRAENGAALLATAANSDGQLVDTTIPSSVAVSDGISTDVAFASSSTILSANWTASTDPDSSIVKYWYAIGTTAGGTNVRSWTDNGLSTSVSATGLTLTDGVTYYFSVRAENAAGLTATAANSNGQTVDTSAPSSVLVSDGPDSDAAYASSTTQLSANWTASADAHSGIARYWYAIGTTAGGTDVRSWTDNGLSTSVTATGLTLTDGVTYYFSVRAENAAGLLATAANSDGQLVDTSAPSSVAVSDSLSTDVDFASSSTQLSANWTASADAHSGIARYWYAIGTTAGGTDVRSWTDNALSTSVTATGLTLTDGVTYYFSVRAENAAGLLATAANSDGQTVDTSAPSSVAVSDSLSTDVDYATSSTQLSANWTASADAHSGIVRYWYAIGTTAGGTDVRSWTDNGLSTSVTATGLTLTDGVTYYFSVRAENAAGLLATAANSDGQLVDTSIPSSVLVSDGPDSDAAYASSTTQLKANWTASADAHSGIARYWYAIGTTAGGTDVRSWTDNALSTSVTATGLSLTEGATYYFTVRSENNAGLLATAADSNGMLVDVTPPSVTSAVTADSDSNGYLDTLTITFDSTLYGSGEIADWSVTDGDGTTVLTTGLTNGNVSVSGTVVTITFANSGGTTGAPTYSYSSAGANNLRDAAGNPVAPFASAVATDNAPPVVMSAAATQQITNNNLPSGTVITITFSEDVIVNGAQISSGDWSVTSGGWHGGASVSYSDGTGYSITATLSSATTSGDWTEAPVPTLNRSSSALTVAGSIKDSSNNDAIANATVNPLIGGIYDVTPPSDVSTVNDGTGADAAYWPYGDRLSANWTASTDPETGIYRYWYAVGTASGTDDVQTWTTNNVNAASDTLTGLSLTDGSTYYFSVKAQNGAYLYSNPRSANGVMVDASAPDSCAVNSITANSSTACQFSTTISSLKTLYYNNNTSCSSGGGTFTVAASGSDPHSKVQKINLPATVSATADSVAPANSATYSSSLLYTYDSADVFSGSASATVYNYSGLTTSCAFSIVRDITAPTTTDDWTDNWTATGSITVTLSPTDGTGAGVASTVYCSDTVNSCSPTTSGTSVAVSCASGSDCAQYVRWLSVDKVSNSETVKSERVRQDLKKPTTTDDWTDNWTAAATVTVTLTPTDGTGSGVASTKYCVDTTNTCSPSTTGTSATTTCPDMQTCTQYVRYMSADNVGNAEDVNSKRVRQDRNLPLAATIAPANVDSGTHVDATFDLSTTFTTTGSAISTCSYCKATDGACDTEWTAATWTASSETCSVSNLTCTNGQTLTLNMRATNNVGGVGYGTAVSRTCDDVAPVTSDNWSGVLSNKSPVSITMTPTDNLSGAQTTYYCVDTANSCNPTTSGTTVSVSCASETVCSQYVRYYSVDKTGNAETVKSQLIKQDMKCPMAMISSPAQNDEIDGGVTITGGAEDENFKEFALRYAPGASPTEWKGVIVATSTTPMSSGSFADWNTSDKYGTYTIKLDVIDQAGNISTATKTVGLFTRTKITNEIPADEWRMISIPAVPDNSEPDKCFNHDDYIILRWNQELPDNEHMMRYTQTFTVTAGRAFWVKSYVVGATCDSPSKVTDTTQPFVMPVDAGWNQIGTPFNRSYSWSDVKFRKTGSTEDVSMDDAITQNLVDKTLNAYENKGYVPKTTLEPTVGYFAKILVDGDLIFEPGAGMTTGVARATPADKYAWRLQLAVKSDGLLDTGNYAGESPYASDAFDSDDAAEPPFIDPFAALYFEHYDWVVPDRYSSDIRSTKRNAVGEEKVWLFTVRIFEPEQTAEISWPNAELLPGNYEFTITDLESGAAINPAATDKYAFKTGKDNERKFSLTAALISGAENIPVDGVAALETGWNLVSIPMELVSPSSSKLLGEYSSVEAIVQYSGDGYSYAGDEEISLAPGAACWLYSTAPGDVAFKGWVIDPDDSISISLAPGFNMIGSPFIDGLLFGDNISVEVDGRLLTLSGAIQEKVLEDGVFEYNTSTGLYTRKHAGNIMEPWRGYIIKVNKACSLILEK